jgi:putative membrane protein
MKRLMLFAVLGLLGAGFSLVQAGQVNEDKDKDKQGTRQGDQTTTDTGTGDQHFVDKAASAGMAEVKLGQVAIQNAINPMVRQFAEQMVRDHLRANRELMSLASRKGITVPRTMDQKHQECMNKLMKSKGNDFDRQYVDAMVKDHKEAVSLFKKQSEDGRDSDLKAFAANTLPTLKHHLQMAQELANQTGSRSSR